MVCVLYAVRFEILILHSMPSGRRDIILPGRLLCCGFILQYFIVKGKKVKERIAVNGTPSHCYGVSLIVWDHTVLPVARHK